MLYRKIEKTIEKHLKSKQKEILLVDGARQVGKTYIIEKIGKRLFKNLISINMIEDKDGLKLFENVHTTSDFYFQLSSINGKDLKGKEDTLVFIDEIQAYPHLLSMLKFLSLEGKFTYIASGSLLGVALSQTSSIPMGSIKKIRMYPLDFEEFLLANSFNHEAIDILRNKFKSLSEIDENTHNNLLRLLKKYLLIGGLPQAVKEFINSQNIMRVRDIHEETHEYYSKDSSNYDLEKKLKIRRVYDLIPSNMENRKKRIIVKNIDNKKGNTFDKYKDEFEYLISSGIALNVQAISNPTFPLKQSSYKNLVKLYMNDVGLLSNILYKNNIQAVLEGTR